MTEQLSRGDHETQTKRLSRIAHGLRNRSNGISSIGRGFQARLIFGGGVLLRYYGASDVMVALRVIILSSCARRSLFSSLPRWWLPTV